MLPLDKILLPSRNKNQSFRSALVLTGKFDLREQNKNGDGCVSMIESEIS